MKIRLLSLLAIVAQISLGNLCLMDMAYAEMPNEMHAMHMASDATDSSGQDCATGHCFMHAAPAKQDSLQAPTPIAAIGTADTLPLSPYVPVDLSAKPHSTAPPGLVTYTKTIVLRF